MGVLYVTSRIRVATCVFSSPLCQRLVRCRRSYLQLRTLSCSRVSTKKHRAFAVFALRRFSGCFRIGAVQDRRRIARNSQSAGPCRVYVQSWSCPVSPCSYFCAPLAQTLPTQCAAVACFSIPPWDFKAGRYHRVVSQFGTALFPLVKINGFLFYW